MTLAALAIQKGDGVKKDPAKAKAILEKLCKEERHKPACDAGGASASGTSAKTGPAGTKAPPAAPKKK